MATPPRACMRANTDCLSQKKKLAIALSNAIGVNHEPVSKYHIVCNRRGDCAFRFVVYQRLDRARLVWKMKKTKPISHLRDLKHDPKNARRHNPRNIGMIEKSLNEVGAARSIVIDENGVVLAGNGLIDAAAQAGIEKVKVVEASGDEIIAVRRTGLSAKQKKRLAIYDNRSSELSEWDADVIADIAKSEKDLLEGMFEEKELREIVAQSNNGVEMMDAEPQIDRAAELQVKWGTARGQVWKIGEHRLMCGDSTSGEDVEKLMEKEKAEMLFTSPPYSDMRTYRGGDMSVDYLINFIPALKPFTNYFVVNLGIKRHEGEVVRYWDDYIAKAYACGLKLLSWNVWDKGTTSIGNQSAMFSIEHEWLFVFGSEPKKLYRTIEKSSKRGKSNMTLRRRQTGQTKFSSIGECFDAKNLPSVVAVQTVKGRGDDDGIHPAKFPVELPVLYIEAMTSEDELIAEPFSGSGTTLIACQNLNRKCRAMEIAPEYVAVALERTATAFPNLKIELIDGQKQNGKAKRKKAK